MSHRAHRTLLHVLLLLAVAIAVQVTPAYTLPAAAAPDDVPTPVANGAVEEWSAGAGLLYWADNCFADEFNVRASLFRKPSSGGTQRTLAAINDGTQCNTFRNQLAAADGLYYFNQLGDSAGRLERMPLGEPFTPQEVKALTAAQFPTTRRSLLEAGDHLYWVGIASIFRTRKDGTGAVETVANTGVSPSDVLVTGATVYWTENSGIRSTTTSCGTLPCTASEQQFANFATNTVGHGLIYQFLGGFQGNFRIYWVERSGTSPTFNYAIRYRSCSQIAVCIFDPVATFYAATANWRIGAPILVAGNLYWSEADQVNVVNGDMKRRAYNAPPGGADTIATGQAGLDERVFATTESLLFARRSVGIYSLSLNAAAILRDFAADDIEVTQAIQNLANEAPLVAEKPTYVRVYGRELSGPNTANVEAWLTGTRNGSPLPGSPLRALNGARPLTTGGIYDRSRLRDGWTFLLPPAWTSAGSTVFSAVVDPRAIHSDPDRSNNSVAKTLAFTKQPPVCVWTVPVRTHTPLPSTGDPNFWGMVSHFNRRWPVPDTWIFRDTEPVEELQVCWYGPFPYPCHGPYELSDGWSLGNGIPDRDKVITSLWGRALLSFNPDACDNIGAPVHFMGMVHPSADNGGSDGYASTLSNQSWVQLPPQTPNPGPAGWDALAAGSVMAQELGHNYGRKHVNCGNPDDLDNSYPYPPCQIANTGAGSYYGFDTTTLQPIRPDAAADFMSYGDRNWVSDHTWRALFNAFAAVHAAAAAPAAPVAGNSIFVTGLVDTANMRGRIATVLQLPTGSVPPATRRQLATAATPLGPAATAYKLRLLDPGGNVLLERPIVLQPLDDHSPESESELFSDLFAPPAGPVAAVELVGDGTRLDVVIAGINAPTVAVQQPGAGVQVDNSLTVQWTANDPDPADRLRFTVQYSHDSGASWHTLALDVPSTPDPVTTLKLDDLGSQHGSAPNTALIRVLASDGYNTAIGVSQPFTLKNRPPVAAISAPAAGQVFPAGPPVMLAGSATDAEDGGLVAAALQWQVDGVFSGAGHLAAASGLAPGVHTAQLTAIDVNGQGATATTPFTVAPLSLPLAGAPVLDGACNDAAYSVGTSLALKPYGDGAQGSVALVRSDNALWACFSGLQKASGGPGAYAGVRADVDNSRSAQAQPGDLGFFAGEDGSVYTRTGNGAGGFVAAAGSGLQAQVAAGANAWSAELRLPKDALGGWDHLAGLAFGHHAFAVAGDDYGWPFGSEWAKPNSWATSALGSQPVITALDPYTAPANSPTLVLAVEGSGFISGTVVLWNGAALATTFVDGEHLTAEVDSALIANAAALAISARTPANFRANEATFLVVAGKPAISGLTPPAALAGSGALVVSVTGSGFASDAQVLWNGEVLPTQFVSPAQLTVQVNATLLAQGGVAGVAVRSQTPEERISLPAEFVVVQNAPLYLPLLRR